jgi:hypothetical protein
MINTVLNSALSHDCIPPLTSWSSFQLRYIRITHLSISSKVHNRGHKSLFSEYNCERIPRAYYTFHPSHSSQFYNSNIWSPLCNFQEPAELSRYSDWLQGGRPWGRSSSPARVKNFHFSMSSRQALGNTQPPIQWVTGGGGLSPAVKHPRREADHSPPTSAEVKKTWIYTSTPPYVSMA